MKVRPNPSVEARPNGRPPGPVRWYGYIFTSPDLASCGRSRLTSNVRPRKIQTHGGSMQQLISQSASQLVVCASRSRLWPVVSFGARPKAHSASEVAAENNRHLAFSVRGLLKSSQSQTSLRCAKRVQSAAWSQSRSRGAYGQHNFEPVQLCSGSRPPSLSTGSAPRIPKFSVLLLCQSQGMQGSALRPLRRVA